MAPIVLPPIHSSLFDALNPTNGRFAKEFEEIDKPIVEMLTESLQQYISLSQYNQRVSLENENAIVDESNGSIYIGEVSSRNTGYRHKHGKGKLTYPNGDVFEGEFKFDNYHGRGKENIR
jgi:hypothetical protein